MQPIQLIPGQRVHIVGIGGSGMSAIARVLLLRGFQVSGSDLRPTPETDALRIEGARIYRGHDAAYVAEAEMVIATSAVPDDHIELLSAQAQAIPIYRRADIMSSLMAGYTGIAIAGTHGKTTTTAMTVHVLSAAEKSPTYIVGGVVSSTGFNADVGTGQAFVIEADEYDNMFHGLRPRIEVLTNVEFDHPDFFETPHALVESFRHFVGLLSEDGLLVACGDDPTAQIFARNRQVVGLPVEVYGLGDNANWRAVNIRHEETITRFDVLRMGDWIGTVTLRVPGRHNILNAMAALVVADHQDVDFRTAASALSQFQGASRRFEVRDEVDGVIVVDDYAHHPTAIARTIEAAHDRYPSHEIWAVWQPHTYSRTQNLWDEFLSAFDAADHVIVTNIYAAREQLNPNVKASDFVSFLNHPSKYHAAQFDDAVDILFETVCAPAVILIMSAGDAPQIGKSYLTRSRMGAS